MQWQTIKHKILNHLFGAYLKLIEGTCRVRFVNESCVSFGHIIGFWHGDSFLMNLVLKNFAKREADIEVIVTADERGDYIEHQIRKFGAGTLRMPDGFRMKPFLKDLMRESEKPNTIMAVSLDGPLGPRYEPKKLAFMLAENGQKNFIGIRIVPSRAIRLTKRWDQYAVPLPFTSITVTMDDFGMITKQDLKEFKEYKEYVRERLVPGENAAEERNAPADTKQDLLNVCTAGSLQNAKSVL
ncbi:hypothetical protein [Diplocloster hominis]|uniref:hypothetical protein n=1 Tax=Diplocloster hominis TaxID=3079010 RepID=UPI0031BA6B98